MRIAVVACGEMGGAVARRLKENGAEIFTSLVGRSNASRARAEAAEIESIDDDAKLIANVDVFLSVVPPVTAVSVAERFAPALARLPRRVLYADCNAVAPATVRAIARIIDATGNSFVDAGIIGGPPGAAGPGPRLYASGEAAQRLDALRSFGLDVRVMTSGIGAASALKLAYASLTKGLSALGVAAATGAASEGVSAALAAELAASQPAMARHLARGMPRIYRKAYRFVGEMEEIARFLGEAPAAEIYLGAAAAYRQVAATWQAEGERAPLCAAIGAAFPAERQAEHAA